MSINKILWPSFHYLCFHNQVDLDYFLQNIEFYILAALPSHNFVA